MTDLRHVAPEEKKHIGKLRNELKEKETEKRNSIKEKHK